MDDTGGNRSCCRCCFSFILTSGVITLFIWISIRAASNPVCSIQGFYLPALNKSANSSSNHTLYLDLKLDNKNTDKGIHYDPLNITLRYGTNHTLNPIILNYTLPGFYQGHKKNARRRNASEPREMPWAEAIAAVDNGSSVFFRVDLASAVRFKIVAWNTKRHALVVGAEVEVGKSGEKVRKKGIRLKSGAPELFRRPVSSGLFIGFCIFLALVFI